MRFINSADCVTVEQTSPCPQVLATGERAEGTRKSNLFASEFSSALSTFRSDERDEPQHRELSVANYVAALCLARLAADEQRLRRTAHPRAAKTPRIMPELLNSPELFKFSPGSGKLVQSESVTRCSTT